MQSRQNLIEKINKSDFLKYKIKGHQDNQNIFKLKTVKTVFCIDLKLSLSKIKFSNSKTNY